MLATIVVAIVGAPAPGYASPSASPFMRVYGSVQAPYGFVQFCNAAPGECADPKPEDERISATTDRLAELDAVNRVINQKILPATDQEIYGVSEYWTLPSMRGDCEDYALLKRKILIERGWPASALLMTVVRDEKGEGHAVLTARTAQGDYILDNKTDDIRMWHETPYEFVMRQSFLSGRVWMSLDPRHVRTPAALAGVRAPSPWATITRP